MNIEAIISIVLIVVALTIAIVLAWTGQWNKVRYMAYMLMLSAERVLDDAEGKAKMDTVCLALYSVLPWYIRKFIGSYEDFRLLLDKWYDKSKDWLDDGVFNQSINAILRDTEPTKKEG